MVKSRKIRLVLRAAGLVVALFGPAVKASPAGEAYNGRPDALAAQILGGQIKPNQHLPLRGNLAETPLCLLAVRDTPSANQAFEWLLSNGADVNLDCQPGMGSVFPLPLDRVVQGIVSTIVNNEQGDVVRAEFLKGRAKRLLQAGAWTHSGDTTLDGVAREAAIYAKWDVEHRARLAQWLREEEAKSAATFRMILGFAAIAAGAYVVSKAPSSGSAAAMQNVAPPSGRPSDTSGGSVASNRPSNAEGGATPTGSAQSGAGGRPGTSTGTVSIASAPQVTASPSVVDQRPDRSSAPKTYSCNAKETKVVDVMPTHKDTEDGWSSSTDSLACAKALRRATIFADNLSNPGFLNVNRAPRTLLAIEPCVFKDGDGGRRYVTVTVRYLYPSESQCDASPSSISR